MKIRSGFVSNSSSSSFILSKNSYLSVFELAKEMIPSRDWSDDADLVENIEKAEIKGMDPNTSICFNSCNYNTYIVKYKEYYLVATCSNHNWDLDQYSLNHFPKELRDLVDWQENPNWGSSFSLAMEELEEVVYTLSSFWYPEYNIGGTPLRYDSPEIEKYACETGEHYWVDIIKINGVKKPVCVACYSEKRAKKEEMKENKKFVSLPLIERVSYVEDKLLSIKSSLGKRDKKRIFNTLEDVKRSICFGKDIKVKNN